jgi:hypothetical protein
MTSGFKVNKQGIAKMMREIQREVNRHPVTVPVQAEPPTSAPWVARAASEVTNIYGPVILGDANGAQLAWGNQSVSQVQNGAQTIASGFEDIAAAVAQVVLEIPGSGLEDEAQERMAEPASEVLNEVVEAEPDKGKIRAAVDRIKGVLAPVALGLSRGAGDGAAEWAKTAISQLDVPI